MVEKKWFFSIDNALGDDFGDHGTETFKNSNDGALKFKKFAREIVQNSIDAKDSSINEPLVVKFKFLDVKKNEFPDFAGVEEHIKGTITYCKSKNKKNNAYNISKRELDILSKDKLRVLKISDYNTCGVRGSKDEDTNKNYWRGLIFNDGDSIKSSNDSLGSHGLGKGAAYALSNLRTVFYNTYDIDGNKAMQGVTRQYVSYVNGQKKHYKGYFGNVSLNEVNPIIDNDIDYPIFKREEKGTDIFVVEPDISYNSIETVKWYLIESVLANFFVAIRDGNLEVVVENLEITQKNLYYIYEALNTFYEKNDLEKSDELIQTQQFLEAMDSSEPIVKDLNGYGEIILWLNKKNDTKGKLVAIVRKNGMFIKNLEVRNANQKFAGVVIATGDEGVEFLRQIEDPNHLDFDPSRVCDEKYGSIADKQKRLNSFYDWIKTEAKLFTKIISEDKMTLSGMEDYIQMPSDKEKIYSPEKMEPTVIKKKENKSSETRVKKKTNVEVVDYGNDITTETKDEPGHGGGTNPDIKPTYNHIENNEGKNKGFVKTYIAAYEAGPVFKFNKNEAVLIFSITQSDKSFKINLLALDEDGKENPFLPDIISAFDVGDNKEILFKKHTLQDVNCKGMMKIKIKFKTEINYCIKPVIYWEE